MNATDDFEQLLRGSKPYSKSAVEREGNKWRDGEVYDQDPIDEFLAFNAEYLSRLLKVAKQTVGSFIAPWKSSRTGDSVHPNSATYVFSARVKTESTLLGKLRRMESTPIPNVHDVAGLRFDCDFSLKEQEQAAEAFAHGFELAGATSVAIKDLRDGSHSGYRAIHLHIRSELGRAEMQIRTALQSKWANLYEEAADIYGRDIRYLHEGAEFPEGAKLVVSELQELSNLVKRVEELENDVTGPLEQQVASLKTDAYGMLEDIHASLRERRTTGEGRSEL